MTNGEQVGTYDLATLQQQISQLQNQLQTLQPQQSRIEDSKHGELAPSAGFAEETLPPVQTVGRHLDIGQIESGITSMDAQIEVPDRVLPGSAYGVPQIPVEDAVQPDVVTVDAETSITEVAEMLSSEGRSSVLVLEDDEPSGIITREAIIQSIGAEDNLQEVVASDLVKEIDSLSRDSTMSEALS